MNWYEGNIADAVAHSKSKNAIFVVYIEGKDDNTRKLNGFINEPAVREKLESDDFVAVKIQSESEAYLQFASLYQMVPVPSIFFIGKSGTPLEIATGILNSVEELDTKIVKVLEMVGKSRAVSTASSTVNNFICQEQKAASAQAQLNENDKTEVDATVAPSVTGTVKERADEQSEIICEGDVCSRKPTQPSTPHEEVNTNSKAASPAIVNDKPPSPVAEVMVEDKTEEIKLAETRKYLEQKRMERVQEEKRLEKERELKRREEGKYVQNLRDWQQEQELKELKENMKRERLEEQAARERIRAQIAADKAERVHKFATDSQPSTSQPLKPTAAAGIAAGIAAATTTTTAAAAPDESRLQFRFGSGLSKNHSFKCSTTLAEVRDYVKNELLPVTGIKDFILVTTYPKREFTVEHDAMNLTELGLVPSAVILVIAKEGSGPSAIISRSGGLLNMLSNIVWTVLNPIIAAIVTGKNWIRERITGGNDDAYSGAQKRANEDAGNKNDLAKRRNLDRFMSGNTEASTSGYINRDKNDSEANTVYRRYVGNSNIHRLSDNRKDSDDENATWNGNSTQQQ